MITANQVRTLKNKIKTEFARRNGYGALNTSPGFTTQPTQNDIIRTQQGVESMNEMLRVEDIGDLRFAKANELIPSSYDNSTMDNKVNQWGNQTMTGSTSSCRNACTGLCLGTCISGRSGC